MLFPRTEKNKEYKNRVHVVPLTVYFGEAAVVITLASKFSGTCQSAMIAASEYDNIYVVDSTSAAIRL